MTEFKWSPGAIEAASVSLFGDGGHGRRHRDEMTKALDAAVKAQPVVALPPCPTCEGTACVPLAPDSRVTTTCPTCNGSGVEQMIPESEVADLVQALDWRRDLDAADLLLHLRRVRES